jgi:putative copper resistance protein D
MLRVSAVGLVIVQAISLYIDSVVLMASAELPFRAVIGANFFVAGSDMLVAAACMFLVTRMSAAIRSLGLPLLVAIILFASVMTSRSVALISGRGPLVALTFLHEAATGLWNGGLAFLILALLSARDGPTRWYLIARFSRVAVLSVGVLVSSGLAMSIAYVGSFGAIFGTAYGIMLVAKAVMLCALIALGGINFFLLRNSTPDTAMPRLRRIVEAELGIGLTVILTAVSLTSQPPAVDLAQNTVSSAMILGRIRPGWPRLTSSPQIPISIDGIHINPAATVLSTVRDADGGFMTRKRLADIEESEANHHWMGLIVLAMGALALAARTGRANWANYWPLLLIGISVFIFLRADTESWPFGDQSFWTSCLNPEVFQHRLAALACAGFAVFELTVRKRSSDNPLALVFPMMCALGGAVLLTHSHSVTNVREEVLAELSHVPLGVLAVIAGWSRWLEVRMSAERRVFSWIWPVCFLLIAAVLLNYREM